MRWPLRGHGDPKPAGAAMRSPATGGAASEPRGRNTASWRRLPPLTLTVAQFPPLLSAGLLTLPDISGTRSLLRPPTGPQVPQARPVRNGDGLAIAGIAVGAVSLVISIAWLTAVATSH